MAATSNERNSFAPEQLIVSMLEDSDVGDQFETFPQHVTLLPWFQLPIRYQGAFDNTLINLAHYTPPLRVVGEERAMFGPEHDVPVTKLRLGALASLHSRLLFAAQRFDAAITSDYVGGKYQPHISDTTDGLTFGVGDEMTLSRLHIVSKEQDSGLRTVRKVISLTGGLHDAPTTRH